MDVLVRFTDVPEDILEYLLDKGYYKTKTEAIRAAILNLGQEYNIFNKEEFLLKQKMESMDEVQKKIKQKDETLDHVMNKYGAK